MIDLKQELQGYRAISLKDITRNEAELSDNIRNSVFLYNKAIESLRSGSEDIAIIELKKAISMNPHFYEAMNLLGLCYSNTKDFDRAAEIFDRVINAEQNSVKALKYKDMINGNEAEGTAKYRTKKRNPDKALYQMDNKNIKSAGSLRKVTIKNWIKYISFFAAGLLLAVLIQATAHKPEKPGNVNNSNTAIESEIKDGEYKKKFEQLEASYKKLQSDRDEALRSVDYFKSVIKLYEIESLVTKKQVENAADLLLLLKTVDFADTEKTRFDNLCKSVMPAAAEAVYYEGYTLYNTKKYQESLKKLEKVEVYDPKYSRMDAVLYYMGKCCQQLNDSRNAVAIFQKLIDRYPDSRYAVNAKSRIAAITQQP